MTCDRGEMLSRYIDGDLGAQEASEMRRHISSCPDCSREYHEIMQSEKTVRDTLTRVIGSMTLVDNVMKRIAKEPLVTEPVAEKAPPPTRKSRTFAWCLGVAIVIITSVMLYRGIINPSPIQIPKDMVVIAGLKGNSVYGNKILPPESTSFALDEPVPMRGTFGFFLHGAHNQPTIFSGSATMRLQFGRIDWVEGEGALAGPPDEKVVVNVGSEVIVINDGCVVFKGSASECSVMLATGTAYHINGNNVEALIINEQCASSASSPVDPPEEASLTSDLVTASSSRHSFFKQAISPLFGLWNHIKSKRFITFASQPALLTSTDIVSSASFNGSHTESNLELPPTAVPAPVREPDGSDKQIKNPFINPLPGKVD